MVIDGPDLASVRALRSRLWEAGFRPVPVYGVFAQVSSPGKQPMGAGWQNAARANPPACTRVPASPAATNTGILCDGFRVIDIDIADHARASEVEAVASDLFGQSPVRFRQNSGKRALLYRASEGEPSKRFISGTHGKVEILGRGQQFVAFGTHDTGAELEWRGGSPGEVSAGDLSPITEDEVTQFLDAIRSIVGAEEIIEKPISERALGAISPRKEITSNSRESAAFFKALTDECRSVASAGQGNRNNTLNTAAFNLAQMVAAGWGSAGEVNAALMDAARECGLPAIEAARTIRSGMTGGAQNPRAALADRRDDKPILDPSPLLRGKAEPVAAGDGDDDDDLDDDGDDFDAAPLDEDLTHVGGVLGSLTDWIADVGSTGNRRLALATALPIMATLLGRRMATPTRNGGGIELYIIATMQSGGGKADQLRAANQIMSKLGLTQQHYTSSEFGSGRALGAFMAAKPLALWMLDEAADYLERILGPGQHYQEIVTLIKKAWGYGFIPFQTTESLSRPSEIVHTPALSICGFTTPEDLFRVIKAKEITSGLVNRFTIIDAGPKTKREPLSSYRNPPDRLLSELRDLYQMGRPNRGNMVGHFSKNADQDPDPIIVPWATKSAEEAWLAYDDECDRMQAENGILGKIYGRTSFQAIKMATIRACGEHAPISVEHVTWGYEIARSSADLFASKLAESMIDPISAAEFFQKIKASFTAPTGKGKALMEQYGGSVLPRQFLWENLKHHTGRNTFDFDNALKAMASNGEISLEDRTNEKTRRVTPCVVYRRRIKRLA